MNVLKHKLRLNAEIDELEQRRAKLREEMARTRDALLPRSELIAAVMRALEQHRADYLQRIGLRLAGMGRPQCAATVEYLAKQTTWLSLNSTAGRPTTEGLLGLLGDLFMPAIARALEDAPYPDDQAGLPSAEREAHLAKLYAEIKACDQRIRALLQQAEDDGIELT